MTEFVSFGNHPPKTGILQLLRKEISEMSLFTKLAIVTAIVFAIVSPRIVGDVQTIIQNAAPPTQLGAGLPANCHLSVDLTTCREKRECHPTPAVVCDHTK